MKNGFLETSIIPAQKSVIVAADVSDWQKFVELVTATVNVPGISGYKLGFSMGLMGLERAATIIKGIGVKYGVDPRIIYDHQKAANDIPETGKQFATVLKNSGINAAILFPFTGPATQRRWTEECSAVGIKVMVGGVMTHPEMLVSEGGYIADGAVERIYDIAAEQGLTNFVVPGTKIDWVRKVRGFLNLSVGQDKYVLYAPGFISQGGDITECGSAAGNFWHAIVGSAIYGKNTVTEMEAAAIAITRKLISEGG